MSPIEVYSLLLLNIVVKKNEWRGSPWCGLLFTTINVIIFLTMWWSKSWKIRVHTTETTVNLFILQQRRSTLDSDWLPAVIKADLDGTTLTYDCHMQLAQVLTCAARCDCRRVLKHVSKSCNFFRVVCDSLGEVVRLIYTKQSVSYGWRVQDACDSRKSKSYRLNRTHGWRNQRSRNMSNCLCLLIPMCCKNKPDTVCHCPHSYWQRKWRHKLFKITWSGTTRDSESL